MPASCPLCASTDNACVTSKVRFGRTASVLRCAGCGLVFLDQESFKFPPDFYEREYHQTYLTHVEPDALDPRKYYEKMVAASKPWCERINSLLQKTDVVLDVGCSTGHVITGIREHAGAVFGHELSKKEVAFCRDVLKLDVSDQPLHERFAPATFDYITLMFVLEHIAQPIEFLRHLKRFLKPGGRLIVLVPNVEDALLNFYDIPAFEEFYFCIEHLAYYSPRTISRLFEKAGLDGTIETAQEYPITNHLNWAYRQRPSETLAARRAVPDFALRTPGLEAEWESFWREADARYHEFLGRHGFSDRIWCNVGDIE